MAETRSRLNERAHILDEATRNRRQRKAIDALEKDNFQELTINIPEYRLQLNKKLQQSLSAETTSDESKRGKRGKSDSRLKHRKNFDTLLEEEQSKAFKNDVNYFTICVPPSRFPPRKFCTVCGHTSTYTCMQCGMRYCSISCQQTHKDTRCLKWTA